MIQLLNGAVRILNRVHSIKLLLRKTKWVFRLLRSALMFPLTWASLLGETADACFEVHWDTRMQNSGQNPHPPSHQLAAAKCWR